MNTAMRVLAALPSRVLLTAARGLLALAGVIVTLKYTLLVLVLGAVVYFRGLRQWRGSSSHGTARFCSLIELAPHLDNDGGLLLGQAEFQRPSMFEAVRAFFSSHVDAATAWDMIAVAVGGSWFPQERLIRVTDYVHLATFCRSGGGKGVSTVIPNLLSYPRSVVVIDPKCENYNKTAAFRRDRFGNTIIRLDPACLGGPGVASFNPLDFIDSNAADFLDQCRDLANMLVVRKGTEHDPHWNDAAELVLTAAIAFVCAWEKVIPDERNLSTVRQLVCRRTCFDDAITLMQGMNHPVLTPVGSQLSWLVDRELGSVLMNVMRHTAWMDSQAVAAGFKRCTFDPRQLRGGRMSIYLVVPPARLETWAGMVRVWLGSLLTILSRDGVGEQNPVLFMLDEVAQLGRMEALEKATTLMRGYGIRLWYILQSVDQLHACYGDKANVILDNLGTQQYFALSSYQTADLLSKRMGDETIRFSTPTTSETTTKGTADGRCGQSFSRTRSSSTNVSQISRKLLLPDEILRLPEDIALVFHRNLPVIQARLLRYYNAPEFAGGGLRQKRNHPLVKYRPAAALLISLVVLMVAAILPAPQLQPPSGMVRRPMPGHSVGSMPAGAVPFPSRAVVTPAGLAGGPAASGLNASKGVVGGK